MLLPNLFILGAPKCGTTAMAAWLAEHDQVFVPAVKEPHFYSAEYRLTRERDAYLALFAAAGPQHLWRCDASVWQLYSRTAVPNILHDTPEARFVVMLRNPLELVPSMHAQQVFSGNERITDLAAAIALSEARQAGARPGVVAEYPADHLAYLHSCALGWQVERLVSRVPRQQIHFVFLEDVRTDPAACLQGIYRFLGLPPALPARLGQVNAAKVRRFAVLDRMVKALGAWKTRTGINVRFGVLSELRKWNRKEQPVAPVAPHLVEAMRRAFAEDTAKLQRLTGRDLSHW